MHGSKAWAGWAELVPPERWNIYRSVIEQANARAIPFALAGAFATATHTGVWRDTNDLDLYTLPENGREMRRLLEGTGLKDIYEEFPYDREWTYRATDGQTIVEVIWRMQNRRADVDLEWLTGWGEIAVRSVKLFVTPPEEMMWAKLYVLCRLRSDWPDVLNYIRVCGSGLDWERLFRRLGEDYPLLGGALSVFAWLSPRGTSAIPGWVWRKAGLREPQAADIEPEHERAALLFGRQNTFAVASGA
jgi:hypothetical protein